MSKLGLGDKEKDHGRDDNYDGRRSRDINDSYSPRPRGGGGEGFEKRGGGSSSSDSDWSSDEEMKKVKKAKGKEMLTAGLATVATIHAAHSCYQSIEKRKKRQKEVQEGTMSPEEAQKLKRKALMSDAANVGIAALGIKSAFSEWKEMNEQRHEARETRENFEKRREKRRQKLSRQTTQGRSGSEPNLNRRYVDDRYNAGDGYAPRYQDGNPYAVNNLPPPPIGVPMRY